MKDTVLVVDDEIGALTLIGIMLERGGFDVLKAKDAKAALTILDRENPSLIILDVMMPGMNGIDLCAEIRSRVRYIWHTLSLSSPHAMMPIALSRGMEAGANDYLPKPILHHDLVTKVRNMIQDADVANPSLYHTTDQLRMINSMCSFSCLNNAMLHLK